MDESFSAARTVSSIVSSPEEYPPSRLVSACPPLIAPLTSAAVDLITRKLNWRPDGSYELLNGAVEKGWDFGRSLNPAESISQLRQILAFDPKLRYPPPRISLATLKRAYRFLLGG